MKIKVNNEDKFVLKKNRPVKIILVVGGILLLLLGLSGIIIDFFFPGESNAYHSWAGEANWSRFLLGIFFLFTYFVITRSKDPDHNAQH